MDKTRLVRFIKKYSLGGIVESVKWESTGTKLSVRFISDDRTVFGNVMLDEFNEFGDIELGVYTTSQLLSMLGILGSDIAMTLTRVGDTAISLDMSDSDMETTARYMLSDLSILTPPPKPTNLPTDFDFGVTLTKKTMDTFMKGVGALSNTKGFSVVTKDAVTSLIIGYSNLASNSISIPVEVSIDGKAVTLPFSAPNFAHMLRANTECDSAIFNISKRGIGKLSFAHDGYTSDYYMSAIQEEK
jgi:hypothetical protein